MTNQYQYLHPSGSWVNIEPDLAKHYPAGKIRIKPDDKLERIKNLAFSQMVEPYEILEQIRRVLNG